MTSYDEAQAVAAAMIQYGGHFVQCLGQALSIADPINRDRIEEAFPEYWAEYAEIAEVNTTTINRDIMDDGFGDRTYRR